MRLANDFDKRLWWKNLDVTWKRIFKQAIDINHNPTDEELNGILILETIDCSKSYVISLEPLQYITGLRKLNCSKTKIRSLDKIQTLTLIDELDCSETNITSLEPIMEFKGLWRLNCSKTGVESLAPLESLPELAYLNCSYTEVDSVKPLERLTCLRLVDCSNTRVRDLSPLSHLPDFDTIVVYANTPVDIEGEDESDDFSDIDPHFEDAARLIVQIQVASTSTLQRKFKLGYSRSSRIMSQLEAAGIVSSIKENGSRDVLIKKDSELRSFLSILRDHQTKGHYFDSPITKPEEPELELIDEQPITAFNHLPTLTSGKEAQSTKEEINDTSSESNLSISHVKPNLFKRLLNSFR